MRFDYGKNGLELSLDPSWNITILRPKRQKIIKHPVNEIKKAIRNPLGTIPLNQIIKNKKSLKRVCIVVSDATRPVPSNLILEALIKELNNYGIQNNQILILIATGLHRQSRKEDFERILGNNLIETIKIMDHDANDLKSMINLGEMPNGTPIYINKLYYESDVKILTGYVEPHFFFGFSGGRKAIIPGIAGNVTIQENHSASHINSINARFGIYKENPMHKEAISIAKLAGVDFIVNVCINEKHEIIKIAAGDLEKAHKYLVNFQFKNVFQYLNNPYDIVICGNGGYPLDLNLYQAIKSMAIGELAVKEGGTIIAVNECIEGIGIGQDKFKELIFSNQSPEVIYDKILNGEINVPDQWQIQVLTRILKKAEICLVSKLKNVEIGNIGLNYAESVENAIKNSLSKYGRDSKILVLPHGPQILPIIMLK